jgi:hypothetical protein
MPTTGARLVAAIAAAAVVVKCNWQASCAFLKDLFVRIFVRQCSGTILELSPDGQLIQNKQARSTLSLLLLLHPTNNVDHIALCAVLQATSTCHALLTCDQTRRYVFFATVRRCNACRQPSAPLQATTPLQSNGMHASQWAPRLRCCLLHQRETILTSD